jgi:phosphotransferase system HPr (HPr) family protein
MSEGSVVHRSHTVKVPNGLHLRPWMQFVKLAQNYKARIEVVKESVRCDARSVLSLLSVGAGRGEVIVVEAWGEDAQAAVDALIGFLDGYEDIEETS